MNAPRIDARRLEEKLAELGKIGESPTGMQRIAFSEYEIEARKITAGWMRDAGLEVRVDPAGNLIGERAGSVSSLPPIAMGSHIDSVPSGGKYDGALGVMAAIEVCRTLQEDKLETRHPIEVIAFTNEEGAFLGRGLLGSRAMVGLLEEPDTTFRDPEGRTYADALPLVGGDGTRLSEAVRKKGDLTAYFELHIEQGPQLIESGNPIGIVTGITGRAVHHVHVRGFWNHAGTTPMSRRKDALAAASRVVLAVQEIPGQPGSCRVGTTGVIHCRPGAVNVIPGEVDLIVEFRDLELEPMKRAARMLRERCASIASETGVEIEVIDTELEHGAPTDPRFREWIGEAADALGLSHEPVPSGAGHDAQAIAEICPIGMVFVPSVKGISHSPHEFSTPEACADGANVLLGALLRADEIL